MVRMGPMRRSMRAANNPDAADNTPIVPSTRPALASVKPNRSNSHRASNDCTVKPPPKASRLNSAARRYTMGRDSPSGAGREAPCGSTELDRVR